MTAADVLQTDTEGCTHTGSDRPRKCGCGQLAAFWTLPAGNCTVCRKPSYYYNPDSPPTSTGWCVGCRDRMMLDDEDLDE